MIIKDIADGGIIFYDESFLPKEDSLLLFDDLKNHVPWKQEFYEGKYMMPRLTAWYADPGKEYTYSGITHIPHPWTSTLLALKAKIEFKVRETFNSCLMNFYRDGSDYVGYHTDAEPELGANPCIASLSLGETRTFIMKYNGSKANVENEVFSLAAGDLLVMAGTSQHKWKHSLPKEMGKGQRINLTFRKIVK